MAGINGGALGSLTIDLNADTARFSSALSKAEQDAENWSKKAVEAAAKAGAAIGGAISIAGFAHSIKGAIDVLDELDDAATKANVSVEVLGGMQFALNMAGVSASQTTDAIAKLNRTIAEAGGGDKKATAAFEAIGVAIKDAEGNLRTADQVFADVADKFKSYADGPEKGALAVALFKKGGEALLPVLNAGGDALRENLEYYRRYSGVSEEAAKKAGEFNDTLDKMALISGGAKTELAVGLLPALQALASEMLTVKENGTAMHVIVGAAKTVFESLAIVGANVAFVFGGIGREIGAVAAQLAALGRGDIKGFRAISDAVKADGERALAELQAFERKVMGLDPSGQWNSGEGLAAGGGTKPRAPVVGKDEKTAKLKDRTAEYEREARRIVEAEEQAAKDTAEAWKAWEKIQLRDAEETATAQAKMWKQVFDEIDAEQTRAIEDGKKYLDAVEKNSDDTFKRLEAAVRGWGNAFTDTLADAVMGAKISFGDLANSIIRDLLRIQIRKSITDPLVDAGTKALDGIFRGSGGNPEAPAGSGAEGGSLLGSLWSSAKGLFGFAEGGSFTVGGSGGIDSQVVAFRASPDETVSITRPGQGGGDVINVYNNTPAQVRTPPPRFDGRRAVRDIFIDLMATDGGFRQSVAAGMRAPA